jgi:hypothetical protein
MKQICAWNFVPLALILAELSLFEITKLLNVYGFVKQIDVSFVSSSFYNLLQPPQDFSFDTMMYLVSWVVITSLIIEIPHKMTNIYILYAFFFTYSLCAKKCDPETSKC